MRIQPWLRLGGIEIANDARTLTYLRRGQAGDPGFDVYTSGSDGPGYSDTYSDIYELGPFDPAALRCYCSSYGSGPFVTPHDDPAPWYEGARAESWEFLGMILEEFEIGPVSVREVSEREQGANIGALRRATRLVTITANMYAASPRGLRWGEIWLGRVLAGTDPALCGGDDLEFYPSCPPDSSYADAYRRIIANAGLVSGPSYQMIDERTDCIMRRVQFTIAAGVPWLEAPAVTYRESVQLTALGSVCANMFAERGVDAGVRIRIDAGTIGTTVENVEIRLTPDAGGACLPVSGTGTTLWTLERLERGMAIIIDTVRRRVDVENVATDTAPVGLDALSWTGMFTWPTIPAGDALCVCVSAPAGAQLNPGTTVTLQRVDREDA